MAGEPGQPLRDRVAGHPVGRLATVSARGRPHVVPCCFALDGDVVYWAVDAKPKRHRRLARLDHIRANPAVSLVIDHYAEDWSALWWVRLDGEARVVTDGPERDRGLRLLLEKYPQYRREPPQGEVVAIRVTRWAAWSAAGTA